MESIESVRNDSKKKKNLLEVPGAYIEVSTFVALCK